MNKNKVINIILILIIMLFMTSCVEKTLQNDTFFTIALGERTVEHGIEKYDQLVWHEELEFIHLRWLFDVLIYFIYSISSFNGIYIFVIIISIIQGLLYYFIVNKFTKNKSLAFIATLVTMYFNKNELAARGQIMSFTLFLLEFYCIEALMKTNKKRYIILLLIIPILIVNFHASVFPMYFVFYLPYIAEFIFAKLKLNKSENSKIIIEERSITKLLIIMILGLFFGFCSPIGIDAYKYMFNVMSGISTDFITELQPINFMEHVYYTILICLVIALISFTKTKVNLTDGLYILGFILLSMPTYRCIFFFYLISSICIFRILNSFLEENNFKMKFLNSKFKNLFIILFLMSLILFSTTTLASELGKDYVDSTKMPINATNYILSSVDLENMKIYNHFNFGSYLEMKGIKVFLDSRSEMYTKEFNPETTILEDWFNLTSGLIHYNEIFDKYEITHALLRNDELVNLYIKNDPKWNEIYQDDMFSIYERVEN